MRRVLTFGFAALGLTLLLAGCGAKPQQAVGVSSGPTIHFLLCPDERVTEVRVTTPGGDVLYRRTFSPATTRTTFRLPSTPRLPAWVGGPDGKAVMKLTHIPSSGIVRGDGKQVTPAGFEEGRDAYCGSVQQDRAAGFAVAFAFLVLAGLFMTRWLRAKRSRDPYDRAWRP
jgi:hypothetical protein